MIITKQCFQIHHHHHSFSFFNFKVEKDEQKKVVIRQKTEQYKNRALYLNSLLPPNEQINSPPPHTLPPNHGIQLKEKTALNRNDSYADDDDNNDYDDNNNDNIEEEKFILFFFKLCFGGNSVF